MNDPLARGLVVTLALEDTRTQTFVSARVLVRNKEATTTILRDHLYRELDI